jgi:hypothetical protein
VRALPLPHLRPARHLVTAPARHSCHLLLEAARGVTIAVVSSRERKRRQPGLATDDPAFVGRHQLVRRVQASKVHADLVCPPSENRRAATRTEEPRRIVACFTLDRHGILREHGGSVKKGSMVLPAVETDGHRRAICLGPRTGRRLLALGSQRDKRGGRLGEALPQSHAGTERDRNPPAVRVG